MRHLDGEMQLVVEFLNEEFKTRVSVINTELGIITEWVEVETMDLSNLPQGAHEDPQEEQATECPGEVHTA